MDLEETVRKYALQNAVQFGGKATMGSVLGKVMAENPDLRQKAKEVSSVAKDIIAAVNRLTPEQQKSALMEAAPELLEKKERVRETGLPDLKNVTGEVRMRMAPNPSGPLHIGHSRMAILNDEYVKRYGGICYNRFEDTDPARIDPSGYDSIPADFDWLGVKIHKTIIQSERFETYYEVAKKLVEMGKAYVCTCRPEVWRDLKNHKKPCPHRELPVEDQMLGLDKMFDGSFKPEEASVVVKTDLNHPNPAIRDFVALRIDDTPHPRTGTKYRVYPLMNLAVAVDDHLLDLTHVLRGKDHLNNTYRQEYIYDYLGWKKPEYIHYGRVSIEDAVLKTSITSKGIKEGQFTGWDDPRLGTIAALRRRGIRPEAIRRYWVETGIKEVDMADRYFFVADPVGVKIEGTGAIAAKAPVHPDHPERGVRELNVTEGSQVFVPKDDLPEDGRKVRLKDLSNFDYKNGRLVFAGNDLSVLKDGVQIIHWAPADAVPAEMLMTDGTTKSGVAERGLLKAKG
ncbi:MAG: glutamate--tRNA ligase, partial [Thermoplasmata archaeon]|nr:glutamate--tRNA ligase [Thermoplasmata archaeon]